MTDENETTETDALLGRSSLGDETTRSLRERTSPQQVDEVLRRAADLRHGEPDSTSVTPPVPPELIELHRSMASLLATRGEWEAAYRYLDMAWKMVDKGAADALEKSQQPQAGRIRDALTNSYNRRYMELRLVLWLANSDLGLVVALLDVDGLRRINDAHGHLVGDRVLQQVAYLLRDAFCARYGGDEFALVFPGVGLAEATAAVESARAAVEQFDWGTVARGLRVTVSAGVAESRARQMLSPYQLLAHANALLHAAKQSRGNAVAYRRDGQVRLVGGREDFSETLTPEGSTT